MRVNYKVRYQPQMNQSELKYQLLLKCLLLLSEFPSLALLKSQRNVMLCLCFKTQMSDLHENELVGRTHFHINGIALRIVLTQKQRKLGNGILSLLSHFFIIIIGILLTKKYSQFASASKCLLLTLHSIPSPQNLGGFF